MYELFRQAQAKLVVFIFLFVILISQIIVLIIRLKKKDLSRRYYILFPLIAICVYFGLFLGLPAVKQLYDIKTENFEFCEGYISNIKDSAVEKAGVILTIDGEEYVLIHQNNYGAQVGDYVLIQYGSISKAIISININSP